MFSVMDIKSLEDLNRENPNLIDSNDYINTLLNFPNFLFSKTMNF